MSNLRALGHLKEIKTSVNQENLQNFNTIMIRKVKILKRNLKKKNGNFFLGMS